MILTITCLIPMRKKVFSKATPIILYLAILAVCPGSTAAKDKICLSPSSIKAKAYGMGGAFTAVLDGSTGILFNPATLELYRFPKTGRLTLFINPVASVEAIRSKTELKKVGGLSGLDWLNYAGMFLKSLIYSLPNFSSSLLLVEELPQDPLAQDSGEMFSSTDLLDRNYSVLTTRLRLAKQIAIGASGYLISAKSLAKKRREIGASYGVLIQPSDKICIGMVYFDFPEDVADFFSIDDRIIDETINVGISYRPHRTLVFAADLRNASEEQRTVKRELHLGMDYTPCSLFALRSGFFHQKDLNQNVYSIGIGLLSSDLFHSEEDQFFVGDFVLNYALQSHVKAAWRDYRHYLTMAIRI